MDLITLGRNYCPGRIIQMYLNYNEDFHTYITYKSRFKLVFIKSGSALIKFRNEERILLSPSILCLSEEDNFEIIRNYDLCGETIYFHPSVVNASLDFPNIRKPHSNKSITDIQDSVLLLPFIVSNSNYSGILDVSYSTLETFLDIFNKLNDELTNQGDGYWPCRSRSHFLEMLILLNKFINSENSSNNPKNLILRTHDADNIILYLYNNINRKITLEMLTQEFHMNRNSLNELFLKTTGITIINYLIQLRIQVSSTLLRETELPILEIIERTGFSDSTHFSRTFKKHMICSPSEYRDQFKNVAGYPIL